MLNNIISPTGTLENKGFGRYTAKELAKELHDLEDLDSVFMVVDVSNKPLGEQVRIARQVKGINGADLAKVWGVSPAYQSRLENGVSVAVDKQLTLINFINNDY